MPVGAVVRVIGAPERQGTIISTTFTNGTRPQVRVKFIDGRISLMPLENLEPVPLSVDAVSEIGDGNFHGPNALRFSLLHQKLDGRLYEMLYSMNASDTTFLAYQFKPVLKLLESPTNSILIADEVGLGKTIEAGLIWTELRAREAASHLLIVCPPHLITKWRIELKRRFGVDAIAADAAMVLEKLTEAQKGQSNGFALVASYHALRPPANYDTDPSVKGAAAELARKLQEWGDNDMPFLDLLVMDEAAIMRNPASQTSELGALVSPLARYKVYLSATPLHTESENLRTLLKNLDPDQFGNAQTFRDILQANAPLVRLREEMLKSHPDADAVRGHVEEALKSDMIRSSRVFAELRSKLEGGVDFGDRKVCTELAYQTERANLLSYVVTRTRRRDVDTNPVVRDVHTISVPLTEPERRLYERVTALTKQYALERSLAEGFLTVTPQRQVASCMAAAYTRLSGESGEEHEGGASSSDPHSKTENPGPLIGFLRSKLAGHFTLKEFTEADSKYEKLLEALRSHWEQHPGSKLVLFAYFKPTLRYLAKRLQADGIPSLLLTGDETGDKQDVVNSFAQSKRENILLSSEVGSEGLDLQFASALVNYDLPWNPMVVEQRIGRIHRIGQEAAKIVVINFVCKGTVDERIYDRLYSRLNLFQRTLGDLESVIGEMITELSKQLLSLRLTPEQELERIDRVASALEQTLCLNERLENNASVLAAYGDYVINRISSAHERGDWIKAEDLESYVYSFFKRYFPNSSLNGVHPTERVYELGFDPDAWHAFEEFVKARNLRARARFRSDAKNRVRFDHQVFKAGSAHTEVIHQSHPLIRFINHYLRTRTLIQPVAAACLIPNESRPDGVSVGRYAFVSQRWSVEGLRCYEKLHHQVVNLDSGEQVTDQVLASTIVEGAATRGAESDMQVLSGGFGLEDLQKLASDLESSAFDEFGHFLSAKEDEDADRKQVQLNGVNLFEERKKATLEGVLQRHLDMGNMSMIAATNGQLAALEKRTATQRQGIQGKLVTGAAETIAAGIVAIC
jgi:superfamily II DNA or RNA helicase